MNALRTIDKVLEHVLGTVELSAPRSVEALESMSTSDVRRELAARGVDAEAELRTLTTAARSRTGDTLGAIHALDTHELRAELEAADVDTDEYLASARALIEGLGARSPTVKGPAGESSSKRSATRGRATPMRENAQTGSASAKGGHPARWGLTRRPGRIGRAIAGVAVVFLVGSVLLERYDAGSWRTATLGEPAPDAVRSSEDRAATGDERDLSHALGLETGDAAPDRPAQAMQAPVEAADDNSARRLAPAAGRIEPAEASEQVAEEVKQSKPAVAAPARMAGSLEDEAPDRRLVTRSLAREIEQREPVTAESAASLSDLATSSNAPVKNRPSKLNRASRPNLSVPLRRACGRRGAQQSKTWPDGAPSPGRTQRVKTRQPPSRQKLSWQRQ